ncbi:MerR family transcriptional regulator [Actinacidiphila epipremni]|uniref:MerR family transcriptional regulator n=1 Tax=Actinacidiphila epipremni TaxID=2053013 RepID=A0ABX1A0R3_9ACTN|nr:MerR family transcriptional regulator [Actinacidiphila epipremni]NJP48356.1 MerR family transcriptional regulator [Actinacidiphila epipremni]
MIGKNDDQRRWSIGELAQETGVTVRTLRHYDHIGLLRASERTPSSHRRYTADDVRRLRRVRALRDLDMSLEEIKGVLGASPEDVAGMRRLLAAQLDELTAQADRLQRLIGQIGGLLQRLDSQSTPDPDQFMTTLEMISVLDRYFTPEERDAVVRLREGLGPQGVEEVKSRWAVLVEQLLGHLRDDTPVGDPQVQDLVRRWDELRADVQRQGAVDEKVVAAARRMGDDHSEELNRSLPWPAEKLRTLPPYLERARAARPAG